MLTCDYVFPAPYDQYNEIIDHDELIYEILADTRTKKSQDEIDLLKYINQATVEAHITTMKKLYQNFVVNKKKLIERDVENYFVSYIRNKLKSRNHPYDHICGCGPNGSTLHYINNDQELKDGQLILMDMGGLAAGYVSDVTSTVPVNGHFTEKQKQIYLNYGLVRAYLFLCKNINKSFNQTTLSFFNSYTFINCKCIFSYSSTSNCYICFFFIHSFYTRRSEKIQI